MKNVIFLIVVFAFSMSASAQKTDTTHKMQHNKMNEPMKDCVMMKDGKMMMMKDGKTMPMDKDMTMKNGTKCMTDGTCMMKDGKKMMMHDGDMMDMNGKMMMKDDKMKDDKMKDDKKKEY